MSRISDFTEMAKQRGVLLDWRHRIMAPDGSIAASTVEGESPIEWGASVNPLDLDPRGASNRLTNLQVPATDPALVPDLSGPLHPDSGYRVTIDAGLVVDGQSIYQRQATMLPEDVLANDASVVDLSVDLVDTSRPVRSEIPTGFQFDAGETVSEVVERLLDPVIDRYLVAATEYTTPSGSIGAGANRGQFIDELLLGIGHELTTTPEGLVITRPILPTADDSGAEFWRYGQDDGIPVNRASRTWTVRSPQGWRIEGGSFQDANPSVGLTVYDLDPTSAGYFSGNEAAVIRATRASFVTRLSQAADAGYGQLRKFGIGPMSVSIWSVPNPGIRQGDIVELYRPNLKANARFRVVGFSLPIQVDGEMRLDLRKVYDPAFGFIQPSDPQDGCHLSYADNFDRFDQNLEDSGGSGSPDWTEHGNGGWAIEGQVATQRNADTDSMALVNRPICSASQFAEITVASLPTGRRIGPVVRSSGQFEGYALMASSVGSVAIERWLNGNRAATLATLNYGTVVGKVMRLASVDRVLTASIDGVVVLAATDDKASGSHAGMLGFGGSSPNGPSASSFAAGTAS